MDTRNQIIEQAIRFIDESQHGYTPELMTDFLLSNPTLRALENLRETVGMWCQSCPVEVQRALHAVPDVDKQHFAHTFEEPEQRMDRLRKQHG